MGMVKAMHITMVIHMATVARKMAEAITLISPYVAR
jgi:hypothetical protein